MSYLNLSSPETYEAVGLTIYRGALPPSLQTELLGELTPLVSEEMQEVNRPRVDMKPRRFRAAPIRDLAAIPLLQTVVAEELSMPGFRTARINVQGARGKQGWHIDYILEPYVIYPEGAGYIDFNTAASTLDEARKSNERDITSIEIGPGDIAALERGGEIFHRGRNADPDATRLTVVLH